MVIIVSFGCSFDYLSDDLSPRKGGVVVFDGLCGSVLWDLKI